MADKNTTTVSYTTKPAYEKVELVGKTVESAGFAGTADRERIARCYITEQAGFDGSQIIVRGADEIGIRSVTAAEITVAIHFVGGDRTPATWKFKGFQAKSKENEGAIDFFVGEEAADKLAALLNTATLVGANKPEYAGIWFVEDVATGKRVFLRAYSPVDAHGNIIG